MKNFAPAYLTPFLAALRSIGAIGLGGATMQVLLCLTPSLASHSTTRPFSSPFLTGLARPSTVSARKTLTAAQPLPSLHSRRRLTQSCLVQDMSATALAMAGAYSLVLVFDFFSERNLIQQKLSRKLVHVLSGLLFMASWPIFSNSPVGRYFAAVVPLANSLRLLVYGCSLAKDEGLVKSVTREGKPEELLRGPLYYVLVLMFCALVFWRESPIGVISLAMMSGGDGVADIMGRKFGMHKLPYNREKSWVGSISMFVFGFCIAIGMLYYFSAFSFFQVDWGSTVEKVALISLAATVVESLPVTEVVDDNISVPLTSMLMATFLFGYSPSL